MPASATLHIGDPSIFGSRLFARLGGFAECASVTEKGESVGLRFTFAWGQIEMRYMIPDEIPSYLEGLAGWIQHAKPERETAIYALTRISCVRMVLNCTIEHPDDGGRPAEEFLLRLNEAAKGMLYVHDSLVDYTGETLAGGWSASY